MFHEAGHISKTGMEKLLLTIPLIENFSGTWVEHHIEKRGDVLCDGGATNAAPIMAFSRAFDESGLSIRFDWPDWQGEAARLSADSSLMDRADLETIRRLLTTHIRKDRFCQGHLASVCESGHIVAALKRLKELWDLGEIRAV
jgi:hypothetical protein